MLLTRIIDAIIKNSCHEECNIDYNKLEDILRDPVEKIESIYGENFLSDEEIKLMVDNTDESSFDILDSKYPELWDIMVDVLADAYYAANW